MDRSPVVRFGPFAFDRAHGILQRDGRPVPIGGRGAALLAALVDAQGQVVTRDELLEAAWPGQVVEEHNLTVQIASLRQAMGGSYDGTEMIRTVSRVGYRLMLDDPPKCSNTIQALRPSVVVLPFGNLSGDPKMAFFADGVTEDIITALSRFKTFAVVAPGSSFALRGSAVPAPDIAQALGVRYLLDGSVRREGHRLRIVARLSDASGIVLWAGSFDEELGGVFEIQDRITAMVVGLVEPQITRAELERSRRKHPENLDAYDHFLQGMACFEHLDASAVLYDRMIGHLDRAVELDPSFSHALTGASKAHELRRIFGDLTPFGTDDFAIAEELADRALALAPDDGLVLANSAMRIHNHRNDGEGALALAERAVALNPYSHSVLRTAAIVQRQRGHADEAIALFERCLRLSPDSTQNAMTVENIGCCHLDVGRYAEAADWVERALAMEASWDLALVNLIVARAMLGQMEEARSVRERFLRVRPGATIRGVMGRLPPGTRQSVEHIWPEVLRRAGLPEG